MPVLARALVALCVLVLFGTTPLGAQADEWTVHASVVDRTGTPVMALSPADFAVRENGVAREILRVSPATDSLRVAMLVDYTRDLKRLETGINRLLPRPGTGSYLLSAIIDTSRAMRKRRDLRRVMVIITTQGPEFSEISYQTVLEYVKESGAPMHAYVLRREGISPTDPAAQEVELTLAVGTRMTGGRREELLSAMSMTAQLQSLAAELNHQYAVVYARPKMLIPPTTIEVGVRRPDVIVLAPRVF